jgi:hypothetical protein
VEGYEFDDFWLHIDDIAVFNVAVEPLPMP